MDSITPAKPYTSRPVDKTFLHLADKSVFKVYFLEITGRPEREKYEWAFCARSQETAVEQLKKQEISGVGFITLYPHISKVFSFGAACETNLYVTAFRGDPFAPFSIHTDSGTEIGCAGEMDVAAQEFECWRASATVDEYIKKFVSPSVCEFRNHRKLWEYAQ